MAYLDSFKTNLSLSQGPGSMKEIGLKKVLETFNFKRKVRRFRPGNLSYNPKIDWYSVQTPLRN
jgi:hypothetical protein